MKVKNIIINIIPLLIWVIYFKLTSVSEKIYFLMPVEDLILTLCIPLFYGIYNSFSKIKEENSKKIKDNNVFVLLTVVQVL